MNGCYNLESCSSDIASCGKEARLPSNKKCDQDATKAFEPAARSRSPFVLSMTVRDARAFLRDSTYEISINEMSDENLAIRSPRTT
jgi:hypothetical protein